MQKFVFVATAPMIKAITKPNPRIVEWAAAKLSNDISASSVFSYEINTHASPVTGCLCDG